MVNENHKTRCCEACTSVMDCTVSCWRLLEELRSWLKVEAGSKQVVGLKLASSSSQAKEEVEVDENVRRR